MATLIEVFKLKLHADNLKDITNLRKSRLLKHLKHLYNVDIKNITRKDVLDVCLTLYKESKYETCKRVYRLMYSLVEYAIIYDLIDENYKNNFSIPISKCFRFPKTSGISWIDDLKDLNTLINYLLNLRCNIAIKNRAILNLFLGLRATNISSNLANRLKDDKGYYLYFENTSMKTKSDFYLGITKELYTFINTNCNNSINKESINYALKGFKADIKGDKKRLSNHSFRKILATFVKDNSLFHTEDIDIALGHQVGSTVTRIYIKSNNLNTTTKVIEFWQEFLFNLNPKLKHYVLKGE